MDLYFGPESVDPLYAAVYRLDGGLDAQDRIFESCQQVLAKRQKFRVDPNSSSPWGEVTYCAEESLVLSSWINEDQSFDRSRWDFLVEPLSQFPTLLLYLIFLLILLPLLLPLSSKHKASPYPPVQTLLRQATQ